MIPIARPFIGREEADAAHRVVLSGWLSQGSEVAAFEAEFAAETGARHACAVSNCTTALHLALLGVGVKPGAEVVTVSHSFIAGPNAIRQAGAVPVFVDIERVGYNIDPDAVAAAITPKTRAILCVHQMGMPCDIAAILPVARSHGLPVIEDAACALGSQILFGGRWLSIGKPLGDVVCFSFHPRKILTTGEGGMLATDNAGLDTFFRLGRQHGMSVPDSVRHDSRTVIFEDYVISGYNYRMTDLQATIGRAQLRRLPEIVARRRALARRYAAMLKVIGQVAVPVEPGWARSNWQSYPVRLDARLDQREVMQAMLNRGVATRRGIMNAHAEPAYANHPLPQDLLRSEAAQHHAILLPLYAQMTQEDQQFVVGALSDSLVAVARQSKTADADRAGT